MEFESQRDFVELKKRFRHPLLLELESRQLEQLKQESRQLEQLKQGNRALYPSVQGLLTLGNIVSVSFC